MKTLNKQHNFAFLTISVLGIVYLLAFFSSFSKLFSGFVMQLIFLTSSGFQFPVSSFLFNITGGLVILYLSFLLIKGTILSLNRYLITKRETGKLTLVRKENYFVFKSTTPTAFTSGFFWPQIYLSLALIKLCSPSELQAILLHESRHQQSHDPLKDFIVRFILSVTPPFPFKDEVFGCYFTLSEVNCDHFACQHLSTRRPLVSALYKILSFNPQLAINLFSANQSDRLHLLINQKHLSLKKLYSYNLLLASFFIVSFLFVSKSSLFIECRHLAACLNSLFQKQSSSMMVHTDGHCEVLREISCQDSL